MTGNSTRAPNGATALTTKEIWDAAHAAWQAAKSEYVTAAAAHDADYDAAEAEGRDFNRDLAAESDRLGEQECEARFALIEAGAPDFPAVALKLELLFGPQNFGTDNDYAPAWNRDFTDALIADMTRLQSQFAEAWIASWKADGGSIIPISDGTARFAFPCYTDAPSYKPSRTDAGKQAALQDGCWNDGNYFGRMNARMRALTDLPGGAAMVRQHVIATGVAVWTEPKEQGK